MLGKFINHCEDSLTAAVFTHLLHLPVEVFWCILRNACYTNTLPNFSGEPLSKEFWPNWDPEGTHNTNRVTPDLFLRFASFDLIIEAKRWDQEMQDRKQWERELTAYINEYGEEKCAVRLIALGGIFYKEDDEIECASLSSSADTRKGAGRIRCPVHMCDWEGLLYQCKRLRRELLRLEYPNSQTSAQVRILDDLIDLFAWHGFQTGMWFGDVVSDPRLPRLGPSIPLHHTAFQRMKTQLDRV